MRGPTSHMAASKSAEVGSALRATLSQRLKRTWTYFPVALHRLPRAHTDWKERGRAFRRAPVEMGAHRLEGTWTYFPPHRAGCQGRTQTGTNVDVLPAALRRLQKGAERQERTFSYVPGTHARRPPSPIEDRPTGLLTAATTGGMVKIAVSAPVRHSLKLRDSRHHRRRRRSTGEVSIKLRTVVLTLAVAALLGRRRPGAFAKRRTTGDG